jgi:hypothetical protein
MHDKIFQTQTEWSNAPTPARSLPGWRTRSAPTRRAECVHRRRREAALIAAALNEGQVAGVTGTPSFEIAGQAAPTATCWWAHSPSAIRPQHRRDADRRQCRRSPEEEAQAEAQATSRFRSGPPPKAGSPTRTAPASTWRATSIAAASGCKGHGGRVLRLQCPFCQRHSLETQPVLDEQFVDTGKVLWIFKHFPLSIHPQAPAAGIAAECAADQGQFWEMHHAAVRERGTLVG